MHHSAFLATHCATWQHATVSPVAFVQRAAHRAPSRLATAYTRGVLTYATGTSRGTQVARPLHGRTGFKPSSRSSRCKRRNKHTNLNGESLQARRTHTHTDTHTNKHTTTNERTNVGSAQSPPPLVRRCARMAPACACRGGGLGLRRAVRLVRTEALTGRAFDGVSSANARRRSPTRPARMHACAHARNRTGAGRAHGCKQTHFYAL